MATQLLLGTTNPARLRYFREILASLPVTLLTLPDLGIASVVEEEGRSPEENAEKKARVYQAASGLPTLATDAALTIDRFPPEKQPGVMVRRIRGTAQEAPETEIVAYYARELEAAGGESPATWSACLVLAASAERRVARSYSFRVLFAARRRGRGGPGVALDALMLDPSTGRSFTEMAWHERPDAPWIREFVRAWLDEGA